MTYLEPSGSQIGHKESMKDTARVLGRTFDGIEYRGFAPGDRRDPREVRRGAGLERADRRVPPDPDPRGRAHHDRAQRQAPDRDRLLLPRRRPQQHGQLADGRRLQARHGRPAVRAGAPVAGRGAGEDVPGDRRGDRRAADPDRRRRRGRAGRRLPLHRRVGVDGRGQERVGGADRAAQAVPGQRGRGRSAPATRRCASCTACRRSTTARPRWARRSSRPTASTAWRSPTTCSSPRPRSSSTRPRTGCTRSRPSWSPRSDR